MGTPEFAASSLSALYALEGVEVVGAFTQPDKPVGRKQILEKPPVKLLAEEHGTPVFQPRKLRDGTALDIVRELDPELIAVVAYGRLIPDDILNYPKYGTINIHGSLLPKYRGAAPIQWSVINGEKETGVSAMYLATEMDAGDIIAMKKTEILEGETSGALFIRLAELGAELLCETVRSIENGTAERTPQDHTLATYAPPLTKELAGINWNMEGRLILSHIRGMDPWPIATTELAGVKFRVFDASFEPGKPVAEAGSIVSADKRGIGVACADGIVTVTELQAPGGKRMKAADYLRGHPICP